MFIEKNERRESRFLFITRITNIASSCPFSLHPSKSQLSQSQLGLVVYIKMKIVILSILLLSLLAPMTSGIFDKLITTYCYLIMLISHENVGLRCFDCHSTFTERNPDCLAGNTAKMPVTECHHSDTHCATASANLTKPVEISGQMVVGPLVGRLCVRSSNYPPADPGIWNYELCDEDLCNTAGTFQKKLNENNLYSHDNLEFKGRPIVYGGLASMILLISCVIGGVFIV